MEHSQTRLIYEQKVLERHKKPIREIILDKRGNGNCSKYYQTTAKWKASGHIRLASYDAVIDTLADYYHITESSIYTVSDIFMIALQYKIDNECPQPGTIHKYKNDYKRFISDEFACKDISSITGEYLNKYSHNLIRTETERGTAMTDKAFKNYKSILNIIFEYAVRSANGMPSIINENPVKHMQNNRYFLKNCTDRYGGINPLLNTAQDYIEDSMVFTEAELNLAITEVRKRMNQKRFTKNDGYYANGYAFLLAKSTGMRVGELMSLRWTDIKNNYIWIHSQQLRQIGNAGDYIYVPWTKDDIKHTGKGRKFPLFNTVKNILDEIKAVQNGLNINSPYVLCHRDGEWLKKEGYETMLRRLFQSLGYRITNNHALRKSLNSNILVPAGIDVTDRAAMLGHSVETNLRNYSFAKKDSIDNLIDTLNTVNFSANKTWEPDGNQISY